MRIFNVSIPDKSLTNIEMSTYVQELEIPHFRGVLMRDTLPLYPFNVDYYDSYGQITPVEIQRYIKTGSEFDRGKEVIQRNTDIIQTANTSVYGHLCLFVLKSLADCEQFQTILIICDITDIHKVSGKIPFKPKKGFVLPKHRLLDIITHYIYN